MTSITNCAATHHRLFLNVFPKSESAKLIPAYMPRPRGGVMPHITPQMHGSIAAARIGFTPFAAKIVMNTGPKITTSEDPGMTMPSRQVIRQMNTTIPNLPMLKPSIKVSISSVTPRSVNIAPIM